MATSKRKSKVGAREVKKFTNTPPTAGQFTITFADGSVWVVPKNESVAAQIPDAVHRYLKLLEDLEPLKF
jgi:hypothetical protein